MDINLGKSNQGHSSARKGDVIVIYCSLSQFMDRKFWLLNEELALKTDRMNKMTLHCLDAKETPKFDILLLDISEYNVRWILFKQQTMHWANGLENVECRCVTLAVSAAASMIMRLITITSLPSPPVMLATARALGNLIRLCLAPGFDIWTFAMLN